MVDGPDLAHPVFVHFYRAVVGHMDVWRQRMDATTNWAAATTAAMVTFGFSTVQTPHFVMLLALAFNSMFLVMESRRYQVFDIWRGRFRLLNRYVVAPVLSGRPEPTEERNTALAGIAEDLGRLVPRVSLAQAVGYRVRRNYGYLFTVTGLAWLLKLELHPETAEGFGALVVRAGVGVVPGSYVLTGVGIAALGILVLAVRAPSERMLNWTTVPSPLLRWFSRPGQQR
jgi:uncharacterized membrane protein